MLVHHDYVRDLDKNTVIYPLLHHPQPTTGIKHSLSYWEFYNGSRLEQWLGSYKRWAADVRKLKMPTEPEKLPWTEP